MFKGFIGSAVAAFLATSAIAEDAVTWEENVDGWRVAIDKTIDNSCFIISSFGNEQYLRLQFNAVQGQVQLIVASLSWDSLETGEEYDIEVRFSDQHTWARTAQGLRWHDVLPSLVMSFPFADEQTKSFIQEFARTGSVRIMYEGAEIADLAMSGAGAAIASMVECQSQMLEAKGDEDAVKDPFAIKSSQT